VWVALDRDHDDVVVQPSTDVIEQISPESTQECVRVCSRSILQCAL
jgi:hypothetical protein